MTDRQLEGDNPFWRFSLAVYDGAGVNEACLAVQDRLGGDVNLLLFCVWLGCARGVRLADTELSAMEQSVAAWNKAAIHPLRAARQAIKVLPEHGFEAVAGFRKDVAALELAAEQIAQALLYAGANGIAGAAPSIAAATGNVALYLERLRQAAGRPQLEISAAPLIEAAARLAR